MMNCLLVSYRTAAFMEDQHRHRRSWSVRQDLNWTTQVAEYRAGYRARGEPAFGRQVNYCGFMHLFHGTNCARLREDINCQPDVDRSSFPYISSKRKTRGGHLFIPRPASAAHNNVVVDRRHQNAASS